MRFLVRLGVWVTWFALVGGILTVLLGLAQPRSLVAMVATWTALGVLTVAVQRQDWSGAIHRGHARRRAALWALGVLTLTILNTSLLLPRTGAWVFFLVVAVFFALLLPTRHVLWVVALSVLGAVLAGRAVGGSGAATTTAGIGIVIVALLAWGIAVMVGRTVGESQRRAQLIATVAESAALVSTLDPDEVRQRVADAAMQLGFDVVVVTEREGDRHRMVVERSRVGPVFDDVAIPLGAMVREAVETQQLVVRDHYLSGPSPNRQMRARGIDAMVISPVVVDRDVVALFVGGMQEPTIQRSRLEAFDLLARLLSHALANARRFERERAAVATLDELGRLKDDFLSNVSHELRTPITVILGGLHTLQRHGDRLDAATRADLVRRAVANAESLQSTLGALLEFARIERGGVDATLHVVDLARLVQESVDRLASMLSQHHVEVVDDGPAPVRAAPGQLDRVVDNLLINVARHTPADTNVQVAVEVGAAHVRVVVLDDGPGIAPADVPRLTDRFFRGGASTTRETRGLGLGLALAQRILEAHDSALDVSSEPGAGSRFAFVLPRAAHDG